MKANEIVVPLACGVAAFTGWIWLSAYAIHALAITWEDWRYGAAMTTQFFGIIFFGWGGGLFGMRLVDRKESSDSERGVTE